jgi:hypothetical protein
VAQAGLDLPGAQMFLNTLFEVQAILELTIQHRFSPRQRRLANFSQKQEVFVSSGLFYPTFINSLNKY